MIVKIGLQDGWHFVDNVEKFQIYQRTHAEFKREEDIEQSECPIQFLVFDKGRREDQIIKVLRIWLRNNYFEKIVVDINNIYLLNDEGKTIERIN